MFTTHESVRLPRISASGFLQWRSVELPNGGPIFLLTMALHPDGSELELAFDVDQELVAFIEANPTGRPIALYVLGPRPASVRTRRLLFSVAQLEVHAMDGSDAAVALRLSDGQIVRARDLAPTAGSGAAMSVKAVFTAR